MENIKDPSEHIPSVLERVRSEYIEKTYGLTQWCDAEDFLSQLAIKTGKLLKVSRVWSCTEWVWLVGRGPVEWVWSVEVWPCTE